MSTHKINKKMLNQVVSQIKKLQKLTDIGHDRRWRQQAWRTYDKSITPLETDNRCQTAMCFAGWAVELDPASQWVWDAKSAAAFTKKHGDDPEYMDYVLATSAEIEDGWAEKVIGPRGTKPWAVPASSRARNLLGLTLHETDYLFAGGNDLPTIEKIVAQIKEGKFR